MPVGGSTLRVCEQECVLHGLSGGLAKNPTRPSSSRLRASRAHPNVSRGVGRAADAIGVREAIKCR